jgi:Xaa-Pro aminopeptidase
LIDKTKILLPKEISDAELKRRWELIREAMKERKLDFLIIETSTNNWFAGYIKWFTDQLMGNGYPGNVIFPREGEMTLISHGGKQTGKPLAPVRPLRGIGKQITVPMLHALGYSSTFDAEETVKELSRFKNCRIGMVGMGFISAAYYKYVTEHLTSAIFEDATDLVDSIKVIKSDEEISLIRETCEMQDRLFEYVQTIVKPGKVDANVRIEIINKVREWGGDEPNILIYTLPPNTGPVMFAPPRIFEEGDQFTVLLETNSLSGFWGELCRTICLGKATAQLQEHFEIAVEAQKLSVSLLKPGASVETIWNANNEFLKKRGYPEETRLYAHGQGYDMVERPCLYPYETMKLQPRMLLAVHPEVKSDRAYGWICDNYLINPEGKIEHLHKTPQKLFVI